jgi:hypothetical protein
LDTPDVMVIFALRQKAVLFNERKDIFTLCASLTQGFGVYPIVLNN